jgi:hypothetical protein
VNVPKAVKIFEPYISLPRAGSLSFTIRLGSSSEQTSIPGFDKADEIIDDIFENIDLINKGEMDILKNKINDNDYYTNFVASSRELAPDGIDFNLVGLTIVRNGNQKNLEFTKKRKDIDILNSSDNIIEKLNKNDQAIIEISGRLSFADDDKNKIKLTTPNKEKHNIKVSAGLSDIVKKYFGENVIIKGKQNNNFIELLSIDPIV